MVKPKWPQKYDSQFLLQHFRPRKPGTNYITFRTRLVLTTISPAVLDPCSFSFRTRIQGYRSVFCPPTCPPPPPPHRRVSNSRRNQLQFPVGTSSASRRKRAGVATLLLTSVSIGPRNHLCRASLSEAGRMRSYSVAAGAMIALSMVGSVHGFAGIAPLARPMNFAPLGLRSQVIITRMQPQSALLLRPTTHRSTRWALLLVSLVRCCARGHARMVWALFDAISDHHVHFRAGLFLGTRAARVEIVEHEGGGPPKWLCAQVKRVDDRAGAHVWGGGAAKRRRGR